MSFTAEEARRLSKRERIRWSRVCLVKSIIKNAAKKGEKSCYIYFELNASEIQKIEEDGFICRPYCSAGLPSADIDPETIWYW